MPDQEFEMELENWRGAELEEKERLVKKEPKLDEVKFWPMLNVNHVIYLWRTGLARGKYYNVFKSSLSQQQVLSIYHSLERNESPTNALFKKADDDFLI